MNTYKQILEDAKKRLKDIHGVNRLTTESVYYIAEKIGYRDLRGFSIKRFAFGEWSNGRNSSVTVFESDSKEKALMFLSGYNEI